MNLYRPQRPAPTRPSVDTLLKQHAATYESLASDYHAARFLDRPGRYDLDETTGLLKAIVGSLVGRSSDWRALDVACGTGKIAVVAAQLGATVSALDASEGMLQRCSARAAEAGVGDRVTPIKASADSLPFEDGTFDIVFSFRFLHLFPPEAYAALVGEMVRVTKPGGHVVVEMKNRWYGGALYWARDLVRTYKGDRGYSNAVGLGQVAALTRQVGEVRLQSVVGLLLPKGWWLAEHRHLAHVARVLARGPLKGVSAHLVTIYRKGEPRVIPLRQAAGRSGRPQAKLSDTSHTR